MWWRAIAYAILAATPLFASQSFAIDDTLGVEIEAPALEPLPPAPMRCPPEAIRPLPAAIPPTLVPFKTSPFPYDGKIPAEGTWFLDYEKNGKRGHTSPRGRLHLEEESYNDKRSLLYLPAGFDLSRPDQALIVVFFHGNYARLQQDVEERQRVPQQLAASGLNAALIAPQFAVNIADSSAGNFWQRDVFKQYLEEAAEHLAKLRGDPCTRAVFERLGVVLVAYSGGYNPAAYALDVGGADARIRGVILLDALYGETDKFDKWIGRLAGQKGPGFFFSAYSDSSRAENIALQRSLAAQHIKMDLPQEPLLLKKGTVTFLPARAGIDHKGFVTDAWVRDPLRAVLSAIEGFRVAPRREPLPPRPRVPLALPRKNAPMHEPPPYARAPQAGARPHASEPPPPTAPPAVGTALPAPPDEEKR